jgi:hypothetical protein
VGGEGGLMEGNEGGGHGECDGGWGRGRGGFPLCYI